MSRDTRFDIVANSNAGCLEAGRRAHVPSGAFSVMVGVNHGVALAARDEPAVDRKRRDDGDRQRDREASPEQHRPEAGVMGVMDVQRSRHKGNWRRERDSNPRYRFKPV